MSDFYLLEALLCQQTVKCHLSYESIIQFPARWQNATIDCRPPAFAGPNLSTRLCSSSRAPPCQTAARPTTFVPETPLRDLAPNDQRGMNI